MAAPGEQVIPPGPGLFSDESLALLLGSSLCLLVGYAASHAAVAALVPIHEGALEYLTQVRALLTGRDHLNPAVVDVLPGSLVYPLLKC